MFSGYPYTGFLVTPGKSINVRSGTLAEYTTHLIAFFDIFFSEPASLSVNYSII